jgi:hypothetical protein
VQYFLLNYDESTMEVLAFQSHGRDFVGALLALTAQLQQHRGRPKTIVRLYTAESLDQLLGQEPALFQHLRFPT